MTSQHWGRGSERGAAGYLGHQVPAASLSLCAQKSRPETPRHTDYHVPGPPVCQALPWALGKQRFS